MEEELSRDIGTICLLRLIAGESAGYNSRYSLPKFGRLTRRPYGLVGKSRPSVLVLPNTSVGAARVYGNTARGESLNRIGNVQNFRGRDQCNVSLMALVEQTTQRTDHAGSYS